METDEIRQIIEQASNDNWIPISIVASVFAVVIALLLYIWKTSQAELKARHDKSESLIVKLTESHQQTSLVLTKLEVMVEFHEKALKDISETHIK